MAELVVVGDAITDVVVQLHDAPVVGSDTPATITTGPGGQGASTAAWAARSGGSVHLVGAVGQDRAGDELEAAVAGVGVHGHLERHPVPSGTIVVLVDPDGERTMLTDRGANQRLSGLPARALGAGVRVHVSGYVLLDPASREAGLRILAEARQAGASVSVSTSSSAPLKAAGPAAFLAWTRAADLLVGNRAEAEVLTGEGDPEAAVRRLVAHYPTVVVTDGAAGVWWATSDEPPSHLAAVPTTAVDSTGAGDAFAAGLLAGLASGGLLDAAVRDGLALAAIATATVGAWPAGQ
jgi:ribokinase